MLARANRNLVRATLNSIGNSVNGSALGDLKLMSVLLRELNSRVYDFPMHLIAGSNFYSFDFGINVGGGVDWIVSRLAEGLLLFPYTHANLFNRIDGLLSSSRRYTPEVADGIVGLSSALWMLNNGEYAVPASARQTRFINHTIILNSRNNTLHKS